MSKEIITIILTDQERSLLSSRYEAIPFSPYKAFSDFERLAIEITRRMLPTDIFNALRDLRNGNIEAGAILIKNTPQDKNLIHTPASSDFDFSTKKTFIPEGFSIGIASLIGEVYAYKNEKKGHKIHNNYPTKKGINTISNEGSAKALPYHVEDVHTAPYHPDYVLLNCLRGCKAAETYLINSADIIKLLDPELIAQLRKKEYYTTPPQSFAGDADGNGTLMPILAGPELQPQMFIEFTDTRGITHKATKALEDFKIICYDLTDKVTVSLEDADLLLFDNRVNCHSRNAYNEDLENGLARWLQRLFIKDGGLLEWKDQMVNSDEKVMKF